MILKGRARKSITSLTFQNLSYSFDDKNTLLENTTVEFPTNKIVHLTGSAGAGKTTTFKILAGLISPSVGSYFINGEDVVPMSFEDFLPYRLNIGFSFDFGGLLANRTLAENLLLPLRYHEMLSTKDANERVDVILKDFGIHLNKDQRPSSVSGGMRKATIVARSLVTFPEMLILDQPTTGLDAIAVNNLIRHIHEGRKSGWLKHVFVASQDKEFLKQLETESFVIFDKKVFDYRDFEKKVIYA